MMAGTTQDWMTPQPSSNEAGLGAGSEFSQSEILVRIDPAAQHRLHERHHETALMCDLDDTCTTLVERLKRRFATEGVLGTPSPLRSSFS